MESTAFGDPITVSPESLAAAFDEVPEPRRAASVVYPLSAMLALTVAALLASPNGARAKRRRCWPRSGLWTGTRPVNRRCTACFGNSMARLWRRP